MLKAPFSPETLMAIKPTWKSVFPPCFDRILWMASTQDFWGDHPFLISSTIKKEPMVLMTASPKPVAVAAPT